MKQVLNIDSLSETPLLHLDGHHKDSCGIGVIAHLSGLASHEIVQDAIYALKAMEHRGALGADGRSGDGVGILLQIPDLFFRRKLAEKGVELPEPGAYGVGVIFGPKDSDGQSWLQDFQASFANLQVACLGWRQVPTVSEALGAMALKSEPQIIQVFFDLQKIPENERDQRLYLVQKQIENAFTHPSQPETYHLVSLDRWTTVYKGMMLAHELVSYFPDLGEKDLKSAFAMVHARFSTNTFPSWKLAQPFKHLCHNGEINTLRGNLAAMSGRESNFAQGLFGDQASLALPLLGQNLSDSGFLDQVFKLLLLSGRSLAEVHMILMPEAWEKNPHLSSALRAFYEYHAPLMEPWDGPAAVVSTDGHAVCISLDRNGLRPCRYAVLDDDRVIVASEMGALPVPFDRVKKMGRIGPGQLLVVDPARGGLLLTDQIKDDVANRRDYSSLVQKSILDIDSLWAIRDLHKQRKSTRLTELKYAFGLTQEEIDMVLKPMAEKAEEPVSSMGDDTPPAFLSNSPRLIFDYFRQQFAQVTNPPIDPLREELVMSLSVYLGHKPSLVDHSQAKLVKLHHPILTEETLNRLTAKEVSGLKVVTLSTLSSIFQEGDQFLDQKTATRQPGELFKNTLERLAKEAVNASYGGAHVILLSDRGSQAGKVPVPILLAVAAVHRALVEEHLKSRTDIIIETAEVRTVHHLACVLGYGAKAVLPYLALDTIGHLFDLQEIKGVSQKSLAEKRYIKALSKGLLKIMSKMGISTLMSYQGAEIFEVLGLGSDLMRSYFPSTPSPIGGVQLAQIEERTLRRHEAVYKSTRIPPLPSGGFIHWRQDGEKHSWSPRAIASMQHGARNSRPESFADYKKEVDREDASPLFLRHLWDFKKTQPLKSASQNSTTHSHQKSPEKSQNPDVEKAEAIVKTFTTGAMSLGAISREAHETLAIAMNRIGGKSNTGEGGEDPIRARPLSSGDSKLSAIRQVASGRFGVTLSYLLDGRELQIKIAQGAKPGEGGQLPGHKVDREIARLRHSTPGVPLISPPPHHDIYSIEDLAQLIYDLKSAHPRALVSVKLVSSTGIGAIAAGVVKAGADKVVVSCGSGGTGASPLSSIKHAGMPWEIGIAEVHQALTINGLRPWVKLEVDGQFKTGRDVVIGALLGADEFGFATAPLIAAGCIMMRKCHLNTCPVGIATQDPELRAKFTGKPEHVINFMFWVAEDARQILGQLGLTSLKEARGRADLLVPKPDLCEPLHLDFSRLLRRVEAPNNMGFLPERPTIDFAPNPSELKGHISTAVRSFGARYASNKLQHSLQQKASDDKPLSSVEKIALSGYAGQSFGAFLTKGLHLHLQGAANDYVGKGLSGGRIVVTLPETASWLEESHALIGNTVLYGATSGELYVAGSAGERFAVRNSGALAVVEGVGDHGCEYMTGGTVVVLGSIGKNFGAGMSGGLAFIYGEQPSIESQFNLEMIELEPLTDDDQRPEAELIKKMLDTHFTLTQSIRAKALLADWPQCLMRFLKVEPKGYRASLARASEVEGDHLPSTFAQLAKTAQGSNKAQREDRHV